ncbi:MAG: flagellar type III secretion system pore protein FliP [Oscillospiraceae bacterium]|nr:flagellar type III secretion system pore protein FliP [Oscillospiraceae bacterium]
MKRSIVCFVFSLITVLFLIFIMSSTVSAESSVNIKVDSQTGGQDSGITDLLFLLCVVVLIPTMLLMMTCFTRIVIAFSFLRNAIGTSGSPPNQVIIGLSAFISVFIMLPVFTQINTQAYKPYKAGDITFQEAVDKGSEPLKVFMLKQVYKDDLDMFMSVADDRGIIDKSQYDSREKLTQLSIWVVTPAFVTSELKRAFIIGFLLYIPFIIIDLVVSSTLMSMGMVMLPPAMISMPFKLMLFILADGWNLLIKSLIVSFN